MRLYCCPGAASLAPQIAFREAGIAAELVAVDAISGIARDGRDLGFLTPLPDMPLLERSDGVTLQGTIPLLHFAAQQAGTTLLPALSNWEWFRLIERMEFISYSLQPSVLGLRRVASTAELKILLGRLGRSLALLDTYLALHPFVGPSDYSIADIHAWTVIAALESGIPRFDNLDRWRRQVAARPAVCAALAAERALFAR
ncbi:hypothetical protein [Sphingomonas azotifigens]|uniref:hypothetical protein n=1 Tax=Sphingomonas azotifigens TaxID=330920 RepID=UPI0009FFCE6C|nr:hypothetical protein [Sphingomonas azotifigens]